MSLEVKLADLQDLAVILQILNGASNWLFAKGITYQWQQEWSEDYITRKIATGDTYLAFQNGKPVGTFALQWSDEIMWGEQPDDAGYVHHLAVDRAEAGSGVGRQLLEWAASEAISRKKKYLRLDCATPNEALRNYYLKAGFNIIGRKIGQWEDFSFDVTLFEKTLAAQPD
jgi:ribosomal protein S18 acetylase RimI-like enzyme